MLNANPHHLPLPDPMFGARPLKRTINAQVLSPLANLILGGGVLDRYGGGSQTVGTASIGDRGGTVVVVDIDQEGELIIRTREGQQT